MDNLISRKSVIEMIKDWNLNQYIINEEDALDDVNALPSAEPDIIFCKDCAKHNKRVGFDENFEPVWKDEACPLCSWRGKAQEHEFDYQYCVYAERKEE